MDFKRPAEWNCLLSSDTEWLILTWAPQIGSTKAVVVKQRKFLHENRKEKVKVVDVIQIPITFSHVNLSGPWTIRILYEELYEKSVVIFVNAFRDLTRFKALLDFLY